MLSISLEMFRGDDESFDIGPVKDKAGAVVDITDLELRFVVGDLQRVPLFQKSTDEGVTITDGPGGIATVDIDAIDTTDLGSRVLYWDLDELDDAIKVRTLASGTLHVKPKMARS
jgi:hypothetical protein